jgi:type IV secretory pathway TraG/TraD family ATPase VirD4
MDRFKDESVKARQWHLSFAALGLAIGLGLLLIAIPLGELGYVFQGRFSPALWLNRTGTYFTVLQTDPRLVRNALQAWWTGELHRTGTPPWQLVTPILALLWFTVMGIIFCPYDSGPTSHGNARIATMKDLKRWKRSRALPRWAVLFLPSWILFWLPLKERRPQNLLDRGGIVLGRFRGKLLRTFETLSALVLAAPGSGKTAGIAVPTILDLGMAAWSLFIYDIKGELYELTSGFRSTLGPVFRFEPKGREGARWNPLSPSRSIPGGQRLIELMEETQKRLGRLYSAESAEIAGRDARKLLLNLVRDHADWRRRLARDPACLGTPLPVPDLKEQLIGNVSSGVGTAISNLFSLDFDGLFSRPGAKPVGSSMPASIAGLAAEMNHILADIETYIMRLASNIKPDNPGAGGNKYFDDTARELLFAQMGFTIFRAIRLGIEPNFGLLIDWWNEALAKGAEDSSAKDDDSGGAGPSQSALSLWIAECEAYGYPKRYQQVLVSQRANAEKTLSNVVSTADTALNIFKLATVRDRTSTSDFALEDIRGMTGKDGKQYPVTVYVVVSLEDIASMAPILMMFTESLQSRLISQSAKFVKTAREVLSILDEFAQIPKMQILLKGPAVGRGQKVANLLIAQSDGQIDETYGKGGRLTLYDTTAWKIVFPLTNRETAENYSTMIGDRTVRQKSYGRTAFDPAAFFGKGGSGPSVNESQSAQRLFTPSDLMSTDDGAKLQPGEHLVIVQGRSNRPIICETPYYYQTKEYKKRSEMPAPASDQAAGFCGKLAHLQPDLPAAADDDIGTDPGVVSAPEGARDAARPSAEPQTAPQSLARAFSEGLVPFKPTDGADTDGAKRGRRKSPGKAA